MPDFQSDMNPNEFLSRYYLKAELQQICRDCGLSTTGSKSELTERIETFLRTGIKKAQLHKKSRKFMEDPSELNEQSLIPDNFHATTKYRKYFEDVLGKTFRFHTRFLSFLKSHPGMTLKQAVDVYQLLLEENKDTPQKIDAQFKYNQYIRDFFKANPKRKLQDAIKCWNYRKFQPGDHRYEDEDLRVLD